MDAKIILMATFTLYKIFGLIAGTVFGYLGYKLFAAGIWGDSGTLQAASKDNKLLLKGAAPGTFFVVLGTIIVGVTLYQGYSFFYTIANETAGTHPPTLP